MSITNGYIKSDPISDSEYSMYFNDMIKALEDKYTMKWENAKRCIDFIKDKIWENFDIFRRFPIKYDRQQKQFFVADKAYFNEILEYSQELYAFSRWEIDADNCISLATGHFRCLLIREEMDEKYLYALQDFIMKEFYRLYEIDECWY